MFNSLVLSLSSFFFAGQQLGSCASFPPSIEQSKCRRRDAQRERERERETERDEEKEEKNYLSVHKICSASMSNEVFISSACSNLCTNTNSRTGCDML